MRIPSTIMQIFKDEEGLRSPSDKTPCGLVVEVS